MPKSVLCGESINKALVSSEDQKPEFELYGCDERAEGPHRVVQPEMRSVDGKDRVTRRRQSDKQIVAKNNPEKSHLKKIFVVRMIFVCLRKKTV